jgi:RNA polymerase sigma factor (sigma-70 family)
MGDDRVALSHDDIARLYRRHATSVLAFIARRVREPDAAVDLMAETFAQAYRDRLGFRGEGDEEAVAWIFGIARHCAASYKRRGELEQRALRRLGVQRRELTDLEYERVERLASLSDIDVQVRVALAALAEEQRDALRLRVFEERSYPEMARELGVTEQTARARVSRALRALREYPIFTDFSSEPDHA